MAVTDPATTADSPAQVQLRLALPVALAFPRDCRAFAVSGESVEFLRLTLDPTQSSPWQREIRELRSANAELTGAVELLRTTKASRTASSASSRDCSGPWGRVDWLRKQCLDCISGFSSGGSHSRRAGVHPSASEARADTRATLRRQKCAAAQIGIWVGMAFFGTVQAVCVWFKSDRETQFPVPIWPGPTDWPGLTADAVLTGAFDFGSRWVFDLALLTINPLIEGALNGRFFVYH
jgi:hypothetical protein